MCDVREDGVHLSLLSDSDGTKIKPSSCQKEGDDDDGRYNIEDNVEVHTSLGLVFQGVKVLIFFSFPLFSVVENEFFLVKKLIFRSF